VTVAAGADGPLGPRRLLRKLDRARYEWGPVLAPRHQLRLAHAAVTDKLARRSYRVLDEAELRATRRSDVVFVLGSGRSVLDVSSDEWARIAGQQTIAFGSFHRKQLVRVDYHMINEISDSRAYGSSIAENPLYDETIFVVQSGWLAHRGNEILGRRWLPAGRRVFRYRRVDRWRYAPPSESFRDGIVHGFNSSVDAANLALLMGWKTIVFVGVDLYDRQYFFLPEGESTSGAHKAHATFTGAEHLIDMYGRWRPLVEARGARLLVHDRRSLLSQVLDEFSWDDV
jgi:hypothetical protein